MRSFTDFTTQAKKTTQLAFKIAAEEAMSWDVFRWAVITLLAFNIVLSLLLYGGAQSEIAALKRERDDYATQLAELRAEVDQKIAKAKTQLSGDIAAARSRLMNELRKARAPSQPQPSTQAIPLPTRAPVRPR